MGPAGQFGHHAAILLMYGLAGYEIGKYFSVAANSRSCFIAGRFYAEDYR